MSWVKIHRRILEWEWYRQGVTKSLMLHFILKANIEDKAFKGTKIKRGSLVCTYPSLSEELGLTVMQVRNSLNKLKVTGEITVKTTNKYSVITVENYEEYQGWNSQDNSQITDKPTVKKPKGSEAGEEFLLKPVEVEEKGKKKTPKHRHGENKKVLLTEGEFEKLKKVFGETGASEKIQDLEDYLIQSGKSYASHYQTILNWEKKERRSGNKCQADKNYVPPKRESGKSLF